jgi:hypothetical protein
MARTVHLADDTELQRSATHADVSVLAGIR